MIYRLLSRVFARIAFLSEHAAMYFLRKVKTAEHKKRFKRDYKTPPMRVRTGPETRGER